MSTSCSAAPRRSRCSTTAACWCGSCSTRHPDTPEETDERITCHQHDERGSLSQSADPRLHAAGLTNFTYLNSLTGQYCRASAPMPVRRWY
nr:SppC [Serratia proteamaculans]